MRFDTHIHLDALPDEALASALFAAPDYRAFVPGIEPAGVAAALLRFGSDARLSFGTSLHPWYLAAPPPSGGPMRPQDDHRWPLLEAQAHDARIAAIGECGLDHLRHTDEETRAWAEACFAAQIALAVAAAKPLVLHCVRAHGRCIELLQHHRGDRVGGIVHAFSGSAEEAAAYRRLGFVVGIGAAVTREAAKRVRTAAATLPSGTFVLETDAPFMAAAPAPAGSGRIDDIEAVAAAVAALRNCATEELYAQTTAVALRLLAPASLPSRGNLGIAAVDPT